MKKFTLLFVLYAISSFTEENNELMEKVLCSRLKGVVLANSAEGLVSECEGCVFQGLEVPGGNSSLAQEIEPLLLGHPLTKSTISLLKEKIVDYYQKHDHPLVSIIIPEQNLAANVLGVVVLESRLGKITVSGNKYSSENHLKKNIRIRPGETINEATLIRDLSWINTNPYRQVNLVYEPGKTRGLTDIDLVVSDRKPWRTYAGGDNTGTPVIGRTRWFTGINLENIFFPDHILSFQFTTANAFHEFKSYTFDYAAPLPWRNTIHFFGAYAAINPSGSLLRSTGKTYQLSGRYTAPQWFKPNFALDQITEEIGFDFKGTNNNIIFGEETTPIVQQLVWIGQFTGSFYLNWDRKNYKVAGGIEGYWSPGQMLAHQTIADFNALRAGSTPKYFYSRFLLSLELFHQKIINFYFRGRGQVSNATLLPSEQFALGGYDTVRGYDERVVNGDDAFCTNVELRSRPFSIASLWTSKVADAMQFLLFFDAGKAWNITPIAGIPNIQSLMGIGPGLRYQIAPFFILRSDLGFPLLKVANDSDGIRLHLSAVLSY